MISVLIALEHAIFRRGVKNILAETLEGATFAEARTAQEALTNTTNYWVRVTDGGNNHVDSTTATITVNALPAITTQPQSQTIFSNHTASLSDGDLPPLAGRGCQSLQVNIRGSPGTVQRLR